MINQKSLLAALAVFLLSGLLLATSPTLERSQRLTTQQELLAEIEQVIPLSSGTVEPVAAVPEKVVSQAISQRTAQGIGILTVEKIGLRLPVVSGVSETQLKSAVGWVPQTAPIGSEGNAVIAGHRSYEYGQLFHRLGELERGDEIEYRSKEWKTMRFQVSEILVVEPGDTAAVQQPEDTQMVTLFTCTPIKTATHRLLIRALRIE